MRLSQGNNYVENYENKLCLNSAGGTQKLARIVGVARAKELIFTGKRMDAQEALAYSK